LQRLDFLHKQREITYKGVKRMKQRKWTVEEKLAIVLEGLKEKRSVAEICREHKISQTLYYRWRDRFLESGKKG